MLGTIEWGVRPNGKYDRKACTIEWHTAHERITCSTIQWDGGYDPIAFLTRMPLHTRYLLTICTETKFCTNDQIQISRRNTQPTPVLSFAMYNLSTAYFSL